MQKAFKQKYKPLTKIFVAANNSYELAQVKDCT